MNTINKIFEHLLGNFKIADYSINQWTGGNNMSRGFADHDIGVVADSDYFFGF